MNLLYRFVCKRIAFINPVQRRFSSSLMNVTRLPKEAMEDMSFFIKNPDSIPTRQVLKLVSMGEMISVDQLSGKLDVEVDDLTKTIETMLGQKLHKDDSVLNLNELSRAQVGSIVQLYDGILNDPQALYDSRPPIVSIMGHVDHGKTTLLDSLRQSQIAKGEFGGITQKIGAFHVNLKTGERVTFIDTPGHEAFANMRVRGAQFTDIIILVVSAIDGVQPQTLEVISIAYNFRIPLIVAINKIDVQGAMPEDVESQLVRDGKLALEGYKNGNIPTIHISAKTGLNLDLLLELVQFQGEIMELKAIKNKLAEGFILEARQSGDLEGRGSTVLVSNGTLKQGDYIIIGEHYSKVRLIKDDLNKVLLEAYPSYAVEILGLQRTPQAGDYFFCVDNEIIARLITNKRKNLIDGQKLKDACLIDGQAGKIKIENRKEKRKIYGDENLLKQKLQIVEDELIEKIMELQRETGEELVGFENAEEEEKFNKETIKKLEALVKLEKSLKEQQTYVSEMIGVSEEHEQTKLNLILKGPDFGTVESLLILMNRVIKEQNINDLDVRIISSGVGKVSIKDIKDAKAFNAQILSMNVELTPEVSRLARELGITLRQHQIIYALIDDIKQIIKAIKEKVDNQDGIKITGSGVIQQVFDVKLKKGSRKVYGSKINSGTINKKQKFRILRDGAVLIKGLEVANLKQYKDEVSQVEEGKDCGITFTQDEDLKIGDVFESYIVKNQ